MTNRPRLGLFALLNMLSSALPYVLTRGFGVSVLVVRDPRLLLARGGHRLDQHPRC
jgi:hypothetical protein